MTVSRHVPRALALPALALLMVAAPLAVPDAARAQTPAATIENASGNVVLESYDDGALLAPSSGTGVIPTEGTGTRMMWYPDQGAFRAGEVDGDEWNDSNIGPRSVAFGNNTTASGNQSTAMGARTTASGTGSTAMGYVTTASGSFSTAMGAQTTASGQASTAMGSNTTASGKESTAMGEGTTASDEESTAMGYQTTASGNKSTAMGHSTTASNNQSTAMGYQTTASGIESTAMGAGTTASGSHSTAMGNNTTASGFRSIAAGFRAAAKSNDSFVWNDGGSYHNIPNASSDGLSSDTDVNGEPVTGAETFSVSAQGGVRFVTGGSSVTYIDGGTTGWSTTSTRSAKTDVTRADPTAVLEAVEAMPISTWEYETESGQGAGTRHIGPMAEDFHGALPYDLGSSEDHINSLNADGVALGAVKGLARKVKRQKETIAALKAENQDIKKRLAAVEAEVSAAPATAGLMGSSAGSWGLALLLGLGGLAGGVLWRRRS